ncbi:MerR family transcriptional regulator [Lactococcus lactis]|uniref:MerR family transcriptional regulator n=1 Tax=Lactococcus lactis TaxID=1358 RepID=UPI0024182584|nr:MerR family transcriptional regulator [Lactococcus lactis]MDG4967175.1 MerR family transcriptional regulator [Lactococcus lactis]
MLTIKEVSKIMCISPYTLRFYDKEGLFPFVKRNERNIRIFTENDLEWVYVVQCLRETGLPIAKIRQYIIMCIEGDQTIPKRLKLLESQRESILLQLSETKEMLDMVDYKITSYRNRINNKTDRIFNPFEKKLAKNKENNTNE